MEDYQSKKWFHFMMYLNTAAETEVVLKVTYRMYLFGEKFTYLKSYMQKSFQF